jgi:hypothetical protein
MSSLTIGSDYSGSSTISGSIQELFIYSGSQATNRTLIENNINNYYNIYTGSNQGFVARWYDQSGNNRHATQTATGSQPIIVLSGSVLTENNRSALTFDGNDFLPFNGSALANTKYSIFAAHSRNFSGQNYILGGNGGNNANLHVGYIGSTSYLLAQYNNDLSGPIPAYTSPILQQFSLINGNSGKAIYYNSSLIASNSDTVNLISYNGSAIGQYFSTLYNGKISEIVMYPTDLTTNRNPIEYNINNYYNIYPQTSSFATSSFTIQAGPTSVSASLNNRLTSGITTSGPLGLITVSRTGSNSLTIARNGVTSSFAVPASGALSTGIYLGAINNNGLALGNSPLNISFASVGTGLTGAETVRYNALVGGLQIDLGRADVDAQSFFIQVANAGGTLSAVEKFAVDILVRQLKFNNIWTKMKALYPMVGASAAACAQNLKSSSFTGTFNGGVTYASTGVKGNGISGYMDTSLTPSTHLSLNNTHISVYIRDNLARNTPAIGNYNVNGANELSIYPRYGNNDVYIRINASSSPITTSTNSQGMHIGSRIVSTEIKYYKNNSSFSLNNNSVGLASSTISLLAMRSSSDIILNYYTGECAFCSIGDGLTDDEAGLFYNAVQAFQTTLGRQV